MIKEVLRAVEADLDAYIDHAADSKLCQKPPCEAFRKAFHAGTLQAYRQAAIRSAEIVYTFYKPSSVVLVYNELEMFVDTMIEYRMEEKLEKAKSS